MTWSITVYEGGGSRSVTSDLPEGGGNSPHSYLKKNNNDQILPLLLIADKSTDLKLRGNL